MCGNNLFDQAFGTRPPVTNEAPKPDFQYTPVDLDASSSLRMRCLELLLQESDWSGIKDLIESAEKLERFVDSGRVPLG